MEFERIKAVIARQLGAEAGKITEKTHFTKDLGADSLDVFQIISELEDEFGIEFASDTAEKIKTVGDVVNYVKNAH